MKNPNKSTILAITTTLGILLIISSTAFYFLSKTNAAPPFNGEVALKHIEYQLSLGPRTPDSPGHEQIISWLQSELMKQGWVVTIQNDIEYGKEVNNIIAYRERDAGDNRGQSDSPWIIIGAHYDTRIFADEDPDSEKQTQPVPGANDGASGVAVLLELARTIPKDLPLDIWLVFFDAEDNGRIETWDWILGSRAFVRSLEQYPDSVVVIDMIGDADLNIFMEKNSNIKMNAEIWGHAAALGYGELFIPAYKYSMLDDHTPFLQAGIPAVDLIDFDYPYWHTTADTLDKVSAESLQAVGDTLIAWLDSKR